MNLNLTSLQTVYNTRLNDLENFETSFPKKTQKSITLLIIVNNEISDNY